MPWVTNDHGISEYKLSIYTKEELPTWDEVYQEFYEKFGMSFYDPENQQHNEFDHYWKIPRYKYLLAIVCNQFNKMIWEDGYNDPLLDHIRTQIDSNVIGIRFFLNDHNCVTRSLKRSMEKHAPDKNRKPLIYTFPLPDGKLNPFIIDKNPELRHDITKDEGALYLLPVIYHENEVFGFTNTDSEYECIMNFMLQPFATYFENGIGWKD